MEHKHLGIQCLKILHHNWILALWKKFLCNKKKFHIFDEYIGVDLSTIETDLIEDKHILMCCACGLVVYVKNIEE